MRKYWISNGTSSKYLYTVDDIKNLASSVFLFNTARTNYDSYKKKNWKGRHGDTHSWFPWTSIQPTKFNKYVSRRNSSKLIFDVEFLTSVLISVKKMSNCFPKCTVQLFFTDHPEEHDIHKNFSISVHDLFVSVNISKVYPVPTCTVLFGVSIIFL